MWGEGAALNAKKSVAEPDEKVGSVAGSVSVAGVMVIIRVKTSMGNEGAMGRDKLGTDVFPG